MKSIAFAAAIALATPGLAQEPLVANAPSSTTVLRTGTQIPLRTLVPLSTKGKTLAVGERVPLEVAESVMLNGQVIIPVGAPGMGEITSVRNKGMWGKSGQFTGRVLYVRVGDRQLKVSGNFDDKGHAGGGAAVATSAIVFLPAGFFMTGTSAKLPIGAPISGFLDEDVPVVLVAQAPVAPLQVVTASAAPIQASVPVAAPASAAPVSGALHK